MQLCRCHHERITSNGGNRLRGLANPHIHYSEIDGGNHMVMVVGAVAPLDSCGTLSCPVWGVCHSGYSGGGT